MSENVKQGLGFGYKDTDGRICMQRCFQCGKENYAWAVYSGFCAWCGYTPNEEKEELIHHNSEHSCRIAFMRDQRDAALAEVERLSTHLTQACNKYRDSETQRDAALARVAVLEGALEKIAHGKATIGVDSDGGPLKGPLDSVMCWKTAQEALSQSPSEALAAVRLAQRALMPCADQDVDFYALEALNAAFGEGEGE